MLPARQPVGGISARFAGIGFTDTSSCDDSLADWRAAGDSAAKVKRLGEIIAGDPGAGRAFDAGAEPGEPFDFRNARRRALDEHLLPGAASLGWKTSRPQASGAKVTYFEGLGRRAGSDPARGIHAETASLDDAVRNSLSCASHCYRAPFELADGGRAWWQRCDALPLVVRSEALAAIRRQHACDTTGAGGHLARGMAFSRLHDRPAKECGDPRDCGRTWSVIGERSCARRHGVCSPKWNSIRVVR